MHDERLWTTPPVMLGIRVALVRMRATGQTELRGQSNQHGAARTLV